MGRNNLEEGENSLKIYMKITSKVLLSIPLIWVVKSSELVLIENVADCFPSLQLFVLLFSDILVQTEQDRSDQLHVMYEPVYLKHITQVDGQRNHSMYCLP